MALIWENITAGYPNRVVLDGFELRLDAGDMVALTGPSGSGKTTIGKLAAGLLRPRSGRVSVDGRTVEAGFAGQPADRRRVQLVPQSAQNATDPRWSLEKIITLPAILSGRTRASALEVAESCGLAPELLDRRPSEVSGGQLTRAVLARALALQPDYLICDEVTSALDTASTAAIAGLVTTAAAAGTGVLVITHDHALATAWTQTQIPIQALDPGARTKIHQQPAPATSGPR